MNKNSASAMPLLQDYDDIIDYIQTEVILSSAFNATKTEASGRYTGLWDTGSTTSSISHAVARELNLVPAGEVTISTANGLLSTDTYVVSIELPNGVAIRNLLASSANIVGDVDILIGMDVISRGDFLISNNSGRTCFSFQMGSDGK